MSGLILDKQWEHPWVLSKSHGTGWGGFQEVISRNIKEVY